MRWVSALAAGLACALTGCGDTLAPDLTDPPAPLASVGSAKEFVTTGGAEITIVVDGFTERYSFVATRGDDGAAVGELTAVAKFFGENFAFHADVTCFTIVGRQARLGGVVTHSTNPVQAPPGTPIIWTVEDNDEGAATPPDRASQITGGNSQLNCATGLSQFRREVTSGNVRVHAAKTF